jgi:hypothetical protein
LPVPVRERPALAVALRGAASPVSVNDAASMPSSGSAATLATAGRRPRFAVLAGRRPRAGGGAFWGWGRPLFFRGLPFSSSSTNSSSPTTTAGACERPSITESAMPVAYSAMARMASSLPGIT